MSSPTTPTAKPGTHARNFLTDKEQPLLVDAIRRVEARTTGELRIHLEDHCPTEDVLERAAQVFASLNMHETAARNGVLIYVAVVDHRFAIAGDEGINTHVSPEFWQGIANEVSEELRAGHALTAMTRATERVGDALARHYPRGDGHNANELSDELSFGPKRH